MRNFLKGAVAVSALALFAFACGGGSAGFTIKTTSPAGTFGGKPWSMTKAAVDRDGDKVSIKLFGSDVADCAFGANDAGYLLFSMPATVGKRPLKFSLDFSDTSNQTVTFVTPPSSNNIATEGLLDLTAVSDAGITLGMAVKIDADNEVNGTFSAPLCP